MRLLKVMITSLLFLAGCETSKETLNKITYYKDERTGLCFVDNVTYYGYDVFTNVPCTPEVEKVISDSRRK